MANPTPMTQPAKPQQQPTTAAVPGKRFDEIFVLMDDQTWIWALVSKTFERLRIEHVRLPSTTPVRHSWERFKNARRIVIHWETRDRSSGAIIEEILDVQPNFDVADRVIVLTSAPTHEDVVYFSELGVKRLIRLRQRDKDMERAAHELEAHLTAEPEKDKVEQSWRKVLHLLDTLPPEPTPEALAKIEDLVRRLKPAEYTARYLDAMAKISMYKEHDDAALKSWYAALDKNPNYYRAYHNLIDFHRRRGRPQDALALMQKMQELNKSNVSRLVGMGELQLEIGDTERAEHCFKTALDRDHWCSGALNGLAEIRFYQGDLEESRRLLARSALAYKAAQNLNKRGIEMVKKGKYNDALEHYTKAQYVLPQQGKGPMLFYNIGLCYSRWGKLDMARQFLKVALIKEPNYKKAEKLLQQIEAKITPGAA
jgi:tetratricopeptide (TPR) repeat protein